MTATGRAPRSRKRHWSRAQRRVLLALLSGAGNLSGYPLCRAAQVWSATTYPTLDWLEATGWVTATWQENPPPQQRGNPRRFYRLTPEGRAAAMKILGLTEGQTDDG